MDIVTLVSNRLEKQDIRFCEAVPIEKRVAICRWKVDCGKHYKKLLRRN